MGDALLSAGTFDHDRLVHRAGSKLETPLPVWRFRLREVRQDEIYAVREGNGRSGDFQRYTLSRSIT